MARQTNISQKAIPATTFSIDKHIVSGGTLRFMDSNGISMVKMIIFLYIKGDDFVVFVVIQRHNHTPPVGYGLDTP